MAFCILPAEKLQIVFTVFILRFSDGILGAAASADASRSVRLLRFGAISSRTRSDTVRLRSCHRATSSFSTLWREWAAGHSLSASGSVIQPARCHRRRLHLLAVESAPTRARTQTPSFTPVCFLVLLSPRLSSRFAPFSVVFWASLNVTRYPLNVCHVTVTWHDTEPCVSPLCLRCLRAPVFFSQPEKIMMKGRSHNDGVGNKRCGARTHTGGWWKDRGTITFSSPPVGVVSGWRSNQACTDIFTWATYGCK